MGEWYRMIDSTQQIVQSFTANLETSTIPKMIYPLIETWVNTLMRLLNYEPLKIVIDKKLNNTILIDIICCKNTAHIEQGLHQCQLDTLELISMIFYHELQEQILQLDSLDFF